MEEQEIPEAISQGKVKRFIKEVRRVIHITKKPTMTEYKTLLKVTAIGTVVLGGIGFIVFIIKQLLL